MTQLTLEQVRKIFRPRKTDSHKGTNGHALLIAGNIGKMGAAVISATACLRSGVGLLSVNVPRAERMILQQCIPEAMLELNFPGRRSMNNFDAIAIGPGIGVNEDSLKKIDQLIQYAEVPLVVDADALNILSKNKKLLKKLPAGTILTPHIKEFDRLYGEHESIDERLEAARRIAKKDKIIIVLKNAETLIAAEEMDTVCRNGNAGLAKGGSGDALTGMILAFLAQGYPAYEAASIAVYLHGVAAGISLEEQSVESMLISDVIKNIGKAFGKVAQ